MFQIIVLIIVLLLVVGIFVVISAGARRRAHTMAESTNRILFAIVILLFALVLKQVSTGMDIVVLLIGLAGLGVGWYGLSAEPH